jgi:4-diphosphocytidyl-2-C-methyl-D-erythritol kinase
MDIRRHGTLIEVCSPAKLNLFLEVLRRREDGYHEIETLMAPISLYDSLLCRPNREGRLGVCCRWAWGIGSQSQRKQTAAAMAWDELPQGGENLVRNALAVLRDRTGSTAGLDVWIIKRIPAAAGLGGASSDAAAALAAANLAWGLGWTRRRLAELAAAVGSDVPFFLDGRAAVCRGRGERIEPADWRTRLHVVVVRPPAGLATSAVYRHCQPADEPQSVEPLLAAARCGDAAGVARRMVNRLQPAAEHLSPWIGRLRQAFDRLGCWGHQMTGSGTSYFGIFRHAEQARCAASRLRAAGWGAVFPAVTLGSERTPRAEPC